MKDKSKSQLYDRLNISVNGINWFIGGLSLLLLIILVIALFNR